MSAQQALLGSTRTCNGAPLLPMFYWHSAATSITWSARVCVMRQRLSPENTLGLMEAMMFASVLLHPGALAILALATFGAVSIGAEATESHQRLTRGRLAAGFAAVFVLSLLMAAASSYVTPEVAAKVGVTPERYWSAVWHNFTTIAVLASYFALLGCAAIGVPVLVQLAKRHLATVPLVVVASVPVSLAFLLGLGLLTSAPSGRLATDIAILVGLHAVLALGFALGARLPWRRPRNEA